MTHAPPRFGIVIDDPSRPLRVDPALQVDLVLLRDTLTEPPRKAGATRRAERLRGLFPSAELLPYVWHLVSHGEADGLRGRGRRTLEGSQHAFGALQDTQEVARAWEATRAYAAGFGASRLVLHTGPSVTPGAVGRKRLAAFAERGRADGLDFIWEPAGLWEADVAEDVARALRVPLLWAAELSGRSAEPPPASAWQLVGGGRSGRLGPDQLLTLEASAADGAVLLFRGDRALANLAAVQHAL